MKHFYFGMTILLAFSCATHAEDIQCHALKYDSYFVAQNLKGNIQSLTPDLNHANFAGHYLLLRSELAMETLYLIASCDTGNFYHEKLNGDAAHFSPESNQLDLVMKNGDSTHYEWDGKSWIQGDTQKGSPLVTSNGVLVRPNESKNAAALTGASPRVSPSPTADKAGLIERYQTLFANYPSSTDKNLTCANLDYSSNFRAQNNKKLIPQLNPDLTHANFAGDKLLIRIESMFETMYLIADCKSGKFADTFLTDSVDFKADSSLVVVKPKDDHPQIMIWANEQWIQIPNPVNEQKELIKNTLYGEDARTLTASLANPHRVDRIRFENLKRSEKLEKLFHDLGTDLILSGECRVLPNKAPVCDVETR